MGSCTRNRSSVCTLLYFVIAGSCLFLSALIPPFIGFTSSVTGCCVLFSITWVFFHICFLYLLSIHLSAISPLIPVQTLPFFPLFPARTSCWVLSNQSQHSSLSQFGPFLLVCFRVSSSSWLSVVCMTFWRPFYGVCLCLLQTWIGYLAVTLCLTAVCFST